MSSKLKASLVVLATILLSVAIPLIVVFLGEYFFYGFAASALGVILYFYYTTLVEQFDREDRLREYLSRSENM